MPIPTGSKLIRSVKFYFREIDKILLFTILAFLVFGIVNMYGVAGGGGLLFKKQILMAIVGLLAMTLFSFFNYRYFKNYSLLVLTAYIFSLALLGLTFYSGAVRGTNSWIIFGNLTFEPAELTKLALIILMAKYFSQRHAHIYQLRHILASGFYFLLPMILIVNQPDLGSAIILGVIWGSFLIAAGINRKHLAILLLLIFVLGYISWIVVLKPYQKNRILSFLDQGRDPLGSGYNLIQSKIAIGSGFWFGNGLGKGSQTNLGFLPESHNDFIFAAFAEQFGMTGMIVAIGLTILILYRIILIGSIAQNNFGKLFAIGLAVFIFSHIFISAGVNVGLLPITGLPFPFLSSGGSNLISVMTGLGILQSIKRYG